MLKNKSMSNKIKVWIDYDFIEKEWCDVPFLFPITWLWYGPRFDYYHKEQIEWWLKIGGKYVKITDIKSCDYIVFPKNYEIKYLPKVKFLCNQAKKYNKKVIVFYMSDVEYPLPKIKNLIVFRSSLNSNNPSNEFPMPWFPNDLIKYREKKFYEDFSNKKISVWYCWYWWYYDLKTKIRFYIYKFAYYIVNTKFTKSLLYFLYEKVFQNERLYALISVIWSWWICRKNIIDILLNEKDLEFKYIQRKKWLWINEKIQRKEYIDNLVNCNFPLVIRWFWNFSFRLSEVISLWKIPLFIDTDCVLPFNDKIDYKKLFIWVPYYDIKNVYRYIDNYVTNNKGRIEDIEETIRRNYEKYFTLSGFYINIIDILLWEE